MSVVYVVLDEHVFTNTENVFNNNENVFTNTENVFFQLTIITLGILLGIFKN